MDGAMKACQNTEVVSYSTFRSIAESADSPVYIPLSIEIPMPDADPAAIYAGLPQSQGFLLESMEGVPKRAVRSIIGTGLLGTLSFSGNLKATGRLAEIFPNSDNISGVNESALDMLEQVISTITGYVSGEGSFTGGMAGYCRYDLVNDITGGMTGAGEEAGPKIRLMVPGELMVFDHIKNTCTLIAGLLVQPGDDLLALYHSALESLEKLKEYSEIPPADQFSPRMPGHADLLPDTDREEYEKAVTVALEHIRAGDIFQVVLSRRFSLPFTNDPFRIYQVLRSINPSPYLYYFNFMDEAVIGSSPEMLVKTEGTEVTTVPIAGTRPRGRTEEEDEQFAQELLADPKERAEHLMLVDLARNDIGRVSEFGSVRVSEFMTVEKFSHVQHITSVVTGVLQKSLHPVDALKACFPAGTVSGAPKIRAMQIIQELEPCPRGLYSGAVGYLTFDGHMEFAIAIRTVLVKNGIATCQAGAGIVADSDPSREFDETQAKVSAMAQAVFCAGGGA